MCAAQWRCCRGVLSWRSPGPGFFFYGQNILASRLNRDDAVGSRATDISSGIHQEISLVRS
jgi:hypothetical protein